jgi:hypothetical protein
MGRNITSVKDLYSERTNAADVRTRYLLLLSHVEQQHWLSIVLFKSGNATQLIDFIWPAK